MYNAAVPRVPPFDRPATYEDLTKLPDNLVAEIVNGELHASPRPAPASREGRLVASGHAHRPRSTTAVAARVAGGSS